MNNGTTGGVTMALRAVAVDAENTENRVLSLLKRVPWTRVAVDVMLLAAMLVVSSKLFSQ